MAFYFGQSTSAIRGLSNCACALKHVDLFLPQGACEPQFLPHLSHKVILISSYYYWQAFCTDPHSQTGPKLYESRISICIFQDGIFHLWYVFGICIQTRMFIYDTYVIICIVFIICIQNGMFIYDTYALFSEFVLNPRWNAYFLLCMHWIQDGMLIIVMYALNGINEDYKKNIIDLSWYTSERRKAVRFSYRNTGFSTYMSRDNVMMLTHVWAINAGNETWALSVYNSGGISLKFIFKERRIT